MTVQGSHNTIGLAAGCVLMGALSLSSVLLSCKEGRYMPDAKFVDSYAELKLASVALSGDLNKANEVRRVILAQREMTPTEFHEHFVQLANHPEAWKEFQEQVIHRIDAFQKGKKGELHGQ